MSTCVGCCDPVVILRIKSEERNGTSFYCVLDTFVDEDLVFHYFQTRTTTSYECSRPIADSSGGSWCMVRQEVRTIPPEWRLQAGTGARPCETLESEGGAIRLEVTDNSATCPPAGHEPGDCGDPPEDAGNVSSDEVSLPGAGDLLAKAISDANAVDPIEIEGDWSTSSITLDPDFPLGGPLGPTGGLMDVTETGCSVTLRRFEVQNGGGVPIEIKFDLVTYRVAGGLVLDTSPRSYTIGPGSSTWIDVSPNEPSDYDAVGSRVENCYTYVA